MGISAEIQLRFLNKSEALSFEPAFLVITFYRIYKIKYEASQNVTIYMQWKSVSVLSDMSAYTISAKVVIDTLHALMKNKASIIVSSGKCTYDVGTKA